MNVIKPPLTMKEPAPSCVFDRVLLMLTQAFLYFAVSIYIGRTIFGKSEDIIESDNLFICCVWTCYLINIHFFVMTTLEQVLICGPLCILHSAAIIFYLCESFSCATVILRCLQDLSPPCYKCSTTVGLKVVQWACCVQSSFTSMSMMPFSTCALSFFTLLNLL